MHPPDHAAGHAGGGGDPALFLLLGLPMLAVLGAYLLAAHRQQASRGQQARKGQRAGKARQAPDERPAARRGWSGWRTAAFVLGAGLVLAAVSPPLADWAHRDLRGHMLQHLLLGMFAPPGLVLGAPGTLLLRSVPVPAARRLTAILALPPVRVLVHPVTAALLDIGGMYLLYLTPLYALSLQDPALHLLLHLHFLLAGCLFTWAIAGPDPAPHRPGRPLRLTVLFLAGAAHAGLGKLLHAQGHLPGVDAGAAELRQAAQWMYYGGDLAELLLAIAFFGAWFHSAGRAGGVRRAAPG